MSVLSTMSVTDAELAARRLQIVTNLLEKTKREKAALSDQVLLLQRTNNELSQYAATFKVDEKAESDQILKAQQEAVSSDFSVANLDDLVMAEDFANSGIGNVMVDMPSLDDIGNF
ncbi:MAG: hypothetical protein SOZ83_03325 [Sphaerochaetaceae bacterium]|nr:hypothetical protein [Spirochaetales bacterium]MDY3768618.1 hypothetical protein [Sphaerochaetaceae bacterium]MDY5967599.1 hypothetical protein [Sphaerochaetaceae bacterium]